MIDSENPWNFGSSCKVFEGTLLFVDFSKPSDSAFRGKMEPILLAYSLPKETVKAWILQYKNTNVKIRSPKWFRDFFDIVAGILQGKTLAGYVFIICLDCVLPSSIDLIKEVGFTQKKGKSCLYPARIIMDTDTADDRALLPNTLTKAELPLHSEWRQNRIHVF